MVTMVRFAFLLLLAGLCTTSSAEGAKSYEVGRGGKLFGSPNVDELLERPYRDFVPMACVGECLWAAHPDGWAFGNGVHYYLLTPSGIAFDLELEADGEPVEIYAATAFPSHVRMKGGAGDLDVTGYKWITADDVLGVRLDICNRSDKACTIWARLIVPSSSVTVEGDRFYWAVESAKRQVLLLGQASGFVSEEKAPETQVAFWTEGEAPVRQKGSEGPDTKAAASAGEVLGSNFGGDENNFAEWRLEVKDPIEDAVLSIRYARAFDGDAEFKITAPSIEFVERYGFQSTGGWGDAAEDFEVGALHLGKVEAGQHAVRAVAVANECNVNIDALCIHPAGSGFPSLTQGQTRLNREVRLGPGESRTVDVFLASSTRRAKAEKALARVAALEDPVADQIGAYNGWVMDNVPAFRSDNEAMTVQYWHRATSVIRKNLFRVGEGRLKRWGMAEGRWNSRWFPNMIAYGGGHQIRETRWLRDPLYVRDIISTWCENQRENGIFPNFIRPDEIGNRQYTDWITSTVWDAYCVAPDLDVLVQWVDALKRNVDGWLAEYDKDNDGLLLVDSHWWTGMEWQPSFFYFKDFDKDRQNQHLERVDLTAYVYGGARNLAKILRTVGDAQGSAHYNVVAEKIKGATLDVMWDNDTKFFYSIEPDTHEKAMVKEVVGVYPFYFSMPPTDSEYLDAWLSVLDPEELWTPWPVASATQKCPAYSQDVMFNGKEVGGCMWNGPTWPHANSIVLSAMAATIRDNQDPLIGPEHFYSLLANYTVAQFRDQIITFPWTGEYYNGETAKWRTNERDYNHSTYIDIIIADMAGLRPREDDILEVHPLIASDMKGFLLDGVRYRGHDITIAWNASGSGTESPDGIEGLRIYADGKLVRHTEDIPKPGLPIALMMNEGFRPMRLVKPESF